ncbi:MAG: stalk domain-containing protein [Cellulosilyticaceae bacterium]
MKKHLKKLLLGGVILSISCASIAVGARSGSVDAKLRYNNYKINVDGEDRVVQLEPFSYNDSIYVPVREIGNLVGANIDWDSATQSVKIRKQTTVDTTKELQEAKQELGNVKMKNTTLEKKVSELEEKIARYEAIEEEKEAEKEEAKLDLVALEKSLTRYYGEDFDVDWEFDLTENKDKLVLEISYSSKQDGKAFDKITDSQLERFIKGILTDVQKECGAVEISGKVYDTTTRTSTATFKMTTKGSVSTTVNRQTLDEDELDRYADRLQSNYHRVPKLAVGGYGENVFADEVELTEKSGVITCKVTTDYSNHSSAISSWNYASYSDVSALKYYMEDILEDIEAKFDVTGTKIIILNEADKTMATYEKGNFDIETL